MEPTQFYQQVREVLESIAPASLQIYGLLRTSGETHPQEAARIARDSFGSFKAAQERILAMRLDLENEHRAARTPGNREPAPFSYRLSVLADLQNTMLWALLGDDSAATNLSASLDVDFGYLSDRNITSVSAAGRQMNEDPNSFVLIADLATGVAIGDLIQFIVTDEPRLRLSLLEIKEGAANAAILKIHDLLEKDDAGLDAAVREFAGRYGERGMKQLERFARQLKRADTYHELISTGSAPDFVKSDEQRIIHLVPSEESYAPALNAILDDFYEHDRGYGFFPVDHLYFGIFAKDETGPNHWRLDFQHSIYHDIQGVSWKTCCFGDDPEKSTFETEFSTYAKLPIEDLRFALQKSFLRPIALTGLSPKYVADILSEALYVWVFAKDEIMIEAFRAAGLDVRLTRSGRGSEHDRSMYQIDGKYIEITINNPHCSEIRLGARPVLRTIFSLQTLASLIDQIKATNFSPELFGQAAEGHNT